MTDSSSLDNLDGFLAAEEISAGRAPRRQPRPGLNRAAVTAAAVTTGVLVAVAAFNAAAPAPHRAAVRVAAARHVAVCNLYVSNAAMIGAIAPTTLSFCPADSAS